MPRPTGEQFIHLYRGLADVTPEQVDAKGAGLHWTTDPESAYNFATSRDAFGWVHEDRDDGPLQGTILEAKVHRRHVVDLNSEEGKDMAEMLSILPPEHPEQETTVRPGAPVHVLRMHYYDYPNQKNERTVINNPLRRRFKA